MENAAEFFLADNEVAARLERQLRISRNSIDGLTIDAIARVIKRVLSDEEADLLVERIQNI